MDWTWWEKMSIAFRKWGRYNGFKVEGKKNYQKTTKIFGRGGKSRKYTEKTVSDSFEMGDSRIVKQQTKRRGKL